MSMDLQILCPPSMINHQENLLGSGIFDPLTAFEAFPSQHQIPVILESPAKTPNFITFEFQNYPWLKCNKAENGTASKKKKRVSFADEKGLNLAQIKMIKDSSEVPPRWSSSYLESLFQSLRKHSKSPRWNLHFDPFSNSNPSSQPAVKLSQIHVCDSDGLITGCVQVRNIAYEKSVSVRCTFDNWRSYEDTYCVYSGPDGSRERDVFRFTLHVPHNLNTQRVEFCIHFLCDGEEYWDNNHGQNYVLTQADNPDKETSAQQPSLVICPKSQKLIDEFCVPYW